MGELNCDALATEYEDYRAGLALPVPAPMPRRGTHGYAEQVKTYKAYQALNKKAYENSQSQTSISGSRQRRTEILQKSTTSRKSRQSRQNQIRRKKSRRRNQKSRRLVKTSMTWLHTIRQKYRCAGYQAHTSYTYIYIIVSQVSD